MKKLDIIRKAENIVGYEKFKVDEKSSDEELDDVLHFICTSLFELEIIVFEINKNYEDD
jgi:hypothetical protein